MAMNQTGPTTEQLQDLLLESAGMTEFLQALATISTPLLGPDALCTITVEPVTAPATAANSTDPGRPDEKQREVDDEPCLTAQPGQLTVLIRQLHIDDRWHRHLISEGHRSVLAVPIPTDAASKAALNCYSPHADAFSPDTVASVQKYAASLSGILRLALRVHGGHHSPGSLPSALEPRATMDAAVSLIMLQNRCSHDSANQLMHLAACDSNRGLHAIAEDILKQTATDAHHDGTS
jgi:hypothetical protein